MLSRLRGHLGTAGLVVAIAALVAALGGGALAASGGSGNGSEATASAKAKKGPRGPKGPKGDTGPAGPQGPAGPAGAKGADGTKGLDGAVGPTGKAGPTGTTGVPGLAGATGPEGSPWTAGGELPPGQTLRGTWSAMQAVDESDEGEVVAPSISFGLTVTPAPEIKFVAGDDPTPPAECPGTAGAPEAEEGFVCVYEGATSESLSNGFLAYQGLDLNTLTPSASPFGALPFLKQKSLGDLAGRPAFGTWAVTAAEE